MKLISFEAAGRSSFGVVKDGKVIDLGPRLALEEIIIDECLFCLLAAIGLLCHRRRERTHETQKCSAQQWKPARMALHDEPPGSIPASSGGGSL